MFEHRFTEHFRSIATLEATSNYTGNELYFFGGKYFFSMDATTT